MAINFSDLGGGGGAATGKTLKGTGTFTLNLADGAHRVTSPSTSYILDGGELKPPGESVILDSITSISSSYATAAPTTASFTTVTTMGGGNNRAMATNGATVIATDSGVLRYSTNNGSSWTYAPLPNESYVDFCAYGNGKFIALGDGTSSYTTIWYSTNGISWTTATLDQTSRTGSEHGIVTHPGGFVAACNGGVFTSTDGITWTWYGGYSIGAPVYEPTSKMFFGYNRSSNNYPMYSYDGKTWSNSGVPSAGTTIRTVAVIPGRVYFFYYNGSKYYDTADFAPGTLVNGPSVGNVNEQNSFFDGIDSSFICDNDTPAQINRLNPDGSITSFDQDGDVSAMAWIPSDGKFWVSTINSTEYSQSAQIAVSAVVETLSAEVISPD